MTIPEDRVYIRLEDVLLVTDSGLREHLAFAPITIGRGREADGGAGDVREGGVGEGIHGGSEAVIARCAVRDPAGSWELAAGSWEALSP